MKDKVKKGLILATCFLLLYVSGVQAQDFCEGNFNYDKDVDGTDAALFKSDFGRSQFQNPCPPDGPAPVPQTGQTKCYDVDGAETYCFLCFPPPTGGCVPLTTQDGSWRKGVAWPNPRFTNNGNGTVTDNLTGLIWLKLGRCFDITNWHGALSDCDGLASGSCGLSDGSSAGDWRLPNLFELESLRDMKYSAPALSNTAGTGHYTADDPFTGLQSFYWSSTTFASNTEQAWCVDMYNGDTDFANKKTLYHDVWCVRGGQ